MFTDMSYSLDVLQLTVVNWAAKVTSIGGYGYIKFIVQFPFFSKCISRLVHHHQGCTFVMRRSIFCNYKQTHDHEYAFYNIDLINIAISKWLVMYGNKEENKNENATIFYY